MNKYVIIGILLVVLIGGGLVFSLTSDSFSCTPEMGEDKSFTVTSKKLEWRFEPETISVNQCDRIKLKVINEDNFDHGVAIDAFGISQRLPANGTIDVEFVASKSGEFPFYCSVSCSDSGNGSFNLPEGKVAAGPYAGTFRGHFDHIGKFIVAIIAAATGTN